MKTFKITLFITEQDFIISARDEGEAIQKAIERYYTIGSLAPTKKIKAKELK